MRTAIRLCINGNLALLCDSPSSSSAGELLHLGNKPEVARAHAASHWNQPCCDVLECIVCEEPHKGLCIAFKPGTAYATALIGNFPAATGAQAAGFTREVTKLKL